MFTFTFGMTKGYSRFHSPHSSNCWLHLLSSGSAPTVWTPGAPRGTANAQQLLPSS